MEKLLLSSFYLFQQVYYKVTCHTLTFNCIRYEKVLVIVDSTFHIIGVIVVEFIE